MRVLLLIVFTLATLSCQKRLEDYKQALVKIYVTKQAQDWESPWLALPATYENFLGVVTKKGILTSAYAVRDARLIEVERIDSTERIQAEVSFVDIEANLALIKLPPKIKSKVRSLRVDDTELDLSESYKVIYMNESLQINQKRASISRVALDSIPNSYRSQAYYFAEFSDRSMLRGELLINEGQIAGMGFTRDDSKLQFVPGFTIKHFISDRHNEASYKGFPGLRVLTELMRDQLYLESMGLDSSTNGLLVTRVLDHEEGDKGLLENDLIVGVDGYELDELSQIKHKLWGKINFKYLFERKYSGDRVTLHVIRKGKRQKVSFPMKRFSSNIGLLPMHSLDPGAYAIVGGLVFQELTVEYLKTFGNDWFKSAPMHLLYLYQQDNLKASDGKRKVVLNKVLADPENRAFHGYGGVVVEKVNNHEVSSIDEFKTILKDKPYIKDGKSYLLVDFMDGQGSLVLSYEAIARSEARIAKNYLQN